MESSDTAPNNVLSVVSTSLWRGPRFRGRSGGELKCDGGDSGRCTKAFATNTGCLPIDVAVMTISPRQPRPRRCMVYRSTT
mmetsp:Transcript_23091/g.51255  ORF Transcript_23091/g.51255 Transcript_23091/m.51255 type:complete len:81 (+) Transcript_23091:694-936(+)